MKDKFISISPIISLTLGIIGSLFFFVFAYPLLNGYSLKNPEMEYIIIPLLSLTILCGIIFGILGLKSTKRKLIAIGGIIMSLIPVIFWALILLMAVVQKTLIPLQ